MDRLRRIELMICAAEAGSFSKAARLLQLDPSALSHAIAELEKDLGLRVFHRTTRQLTLTEEGHNVMRHGRTMLRELAEIRALAPQAQQRLKGTLRVGMSVSLSHHVMMPRMAEFMRRHPDIRLECLILNQARDMHAAGLDILFQSGSPADSDLVSRKVVTLKLGVYAAPSYLARAGEPDKPEDLLQHACLVHRPSFTNKGWNDWKFQKGSQSLSIKVPASLMTDDREGLIAVALAGGGIMRIGMFDPALLAEGRLRQVLSAWACPGGPTINVLFHKSSRANPRVLAFLQFVDEVFGDFDPGEQTLEHHSRAGSRSPAVVA
jgi:DNA-binding transcriptional LysR family regulator